MWIDNILWEDKRINSEVFEARRKRQVDANANDGPEQP